MAKKRVFLSYSHEDSALKDEFLEHFSSLERADVAEVWHDRSLLPGDIIEAEIIQRIQDSDLFVFLISSAFIRSEFCWSEEMHEALKLAEANKLAVVGIVVRECVFTGAPFEHRLLLPTDAKPVTGPTWHNRDQAWTDVIKQLLLLCAALPEPTERPAFTAAAQVEEPAGETATRGSEKRLRVAVVQPELVRPEGLAEMVGVIEVEFLGDYADSEICDLHLYLNTNVMSQRFTESVTECRLEFEPQIAYPRDRDLRPRYANALGVNGLGFSTLPVGAIRGRYGKALARIIGIRVNANQLGIASTVPVVVSLTVPQFGKQSVEQTDLAYFSSRANAKVMREKFWNTDAPTVGEVVDLISKYPKGHAPLLFRVAFTTYFGRWELPGKSTRVALRLTGLTSYLLPIYSTALIGSSDPSLSARLVQTDANGAGLSIYLDQTLTLVDESQRLVAGHLSDSSVGGYSMAVWEVQDAALLAVQTIEVGIGLSIRPWPDIPKDIFDDVLDLSLATFLAPLSTVAIGSMRSPAPSFADTSRTIKLLGP
jgi:TIR domain